MAEMTVGEAKELTCIKSSIGHEGIQYIVGRPFVTPEKYACATELRRLADAVEDQRSRMDWDEADKLNAAMPIEGMTAEQLTAELNAEELRGAGNA